MGTKGTVECYRMCQRKNLSSSQAFTVLIALSLGEHEIA